MSHISYSQIKAYNTCHRKYYLYYRKRLRSSYKHVALFYGSALDQALNTLLTKDSKEDPTKVFEKAFTFAELNRKGQLEFIPDNPKVVYAEKDFQEKLLTKEDVELIFKKAEELKIDVEHISEFVKTFLWAKSENGISQLSENRVRLYNFILWRNLFRKGLITLESYKKEVIPKIKSVIAVQEKIEATNAAGDTLIGFADVILEMQDGNRVLFDHKTSSLEYHKDASEYSSQLALYFHFLKEKYNLTHVGYIVMQKRIVFDTKRTCKDCGHIIVSRCKTCDNVLDGLRCGGEILEEGIPSCTINMQQSEVSPFTEELVFRSFDESNKAIKSENFSPNLDACKPISGLQCEYSRYCHFGSTKDMEEV